MPEQTRVQPSTSERAEAPKPSDVKQSERSAKAGGKIKADLDDLLDEIDELLLDNEEIATNFRQRGGE